MDNDSVKRPSAGWQNWRMGECYDAFVSYSHVADGRLAAELQRGLQRLARPVFARRSLRVFRDETGLSTNPHLWGSIEAALSVSEWFVLLASPEAARSEWVTRELTAWLSSKPLERILVVVTDGQLGFMSDGVVDRGVTTCLPEVFINALTGEPRWLDLRWARGEDQLDLRNGRFRAAVADLAAPIHGIPKDDLESDDVRQQRRARRWAWTAATIVAVLAVIAVATAIVAIGQRHQANSQRRQAEAARTEAITQQQIAAQAADQANAQRREAEAARTEAITQQQIAAQEALVNAAVAERGSRRDLAALLAVEAHRRFPSAATENALFGLFTQFPGVGRTVDFADGPVASDYAMLLPDGATIAAADKSDAVRLIDVTTGRDVARLETGGEHSDSGWTEWFAATPDSRLLAVAITRGVAQSDGSTATSTNLSVWNVATRKAVFAPFEMPTTGVGSLALSHDGQLLAVAGGEAGRTLILDATTGTVLREVAPIPRPDGAKYHNNTVAVSFMADDRLIVTSQAGPIRIVDAHTGAELQHFVSPQETSEAAAILAPDESWLLTNGARGLMRFDLTAGGRQAWAAPSEHTCQLNSVAPIGLAVCVEDGGLVTSIDLATGAVAPTHFDGMTGAIGSAATPDGSTVIVYSDERYSLWHTDGSGLANRVLSRSDSPFIAGYTSDGTRLLLDTDGADGPAVEVVDAATGKVVDRIAGASMVHPTEAPDKVIMQFADGRVGWYDLKAHAPTGAPVDPFPEPGRDPADLVPTTRGAVAWWFDGTMVALDLAEGRVIPTNPSIGDRHVWEFVASPDGRPYTLTFDPTRSGPTDALQRRDPASLAEQASTTGAVVGPRVLVAGSGVLVLSTTRGDHYLLDPDTLQVTGSLPATRGFFTDLALDAGEHRLLALGADNELRLYDLDARLQLGVGLSFSAAVPSDTVGKRGLALRPDGHQAAFVVPGGIAIWDLDPGHWVTAACELASRNLTREEWKTYLGASFEYRATCPQFPVDP
jgi:WD40 repeat protein